MDAVDEARMRIAAAAVRVAEAASYPFDNNEKPTPNRQDFPTTESERDLKMSRLKERAEVIKLAGEAVGALDGPQGGRMTYKYIADYHYTTHVGKDDRDRRPGFTPPTRPEERL